MHGEITGTERKVSSEALAKEDITYGLQASLGTTSRLSRPEYAQIWAPGDQNGLHFPNNVIGPNHVIRLAESASS
jgi:hypothetical protein